MSHSDRITVQQLRKAFATFKTGCSNTQVDHLPPEACDECTAAFLRAVRSIVNGAGEPENRSEISGGTPVSGQS